MTIEEIRKLPACLYYENPGSPDGCRRHPNNDDDWDELEDPCYWCSGWRHNNLENLKKMSFEEAQEMIEKLRRD